MSTDYGDTWTEISGTQLGSTIINAVVVNAEGTIYAGCSPLAVYKSADAGSSWTVVNEGLEGREVFCLAVDDEGLLYTGTTYGGAFRTEESTLAAEPLDLPREMTLEQNYPNPFVESTEIRIRGWNPDAVFSLKVFDQLGREVLNLSLPARANGTAMITRSMLPSGGLYYYELTSRDGRQSRSMMLLR